MTSEEDERGETRNEKEGETNRYKMRIRIKRGDKRTRLF